MTTNGVMALFCVISANSGSFRAHCVKVHVRYLISWWVLVLVSWSCSFFHILFLMTSIHSVTVVLSPTLSSQNVIGRQYPGEAVSRELCQWRHGYAEMTSLDRRKDREIEWRYNFLAGFSARDRPFASVSFNQSSFLVDRPGGRKPSSSAFMFYQSAVFSAHF